MPQSASFFTDSRLNGVVQQQGFMGPVARFWARSYTADYLGLVLLLVACMMLQFFVEPFHRMFSLDNLAIQYPHAVVERVPPIWLFAYACGIPLLVLALWAILLRPATHKVHATLLGLMISVAMATFLTDTVKNSVGRPRPDLLARCKAAKNTPEHSLVTWEVCTETDHHVLHDGWRSFPSGHSSLAFSGLGYLSLFLAGQMQVFRPQADLTRVLLALGPLLGALLIAISRCEDYRHDVYDVTAGSLLGMMIAFFSYRRYYPQLQASRCEEPYPKRGDSPHAPGFGMLKDDESRVGVSDSRSEADVDVRGESVPLRSGRRSSEDNQQSIR